MKNFYLLFALLSLVCQATAQVSINSDNSAPDPSAMLDVKSSNKGFLPPRMTHAEINAIVNPINGLMIFCTDCESTGSGAMVMFLNGTWHTFNINCMGPMFPAAGVHTASVSQITWNWNTVSDATGYKWNTTDNYSAATDMGTTSTITETGLNCNTAYSRYVWAYNACGNSGANALTQSTTQSPAVGITINASTNPVCSGTTVTFTATPVNGGSTPSWQWQKNGTSVSGATNSTYAYAPMHGDHITCQINSSNPCTPNNPAVSNGITMTVNALVTPSVTIAASANPVCAGSVVTFTATPVNGGPNPGYQWIKSGSSLSGATNATFSYIPVQGDQVSCQLTADLVCTQTNPVVSGVITMTVVALATPSVTISASANPVSVGTTVTFSAAAINGGSLPQFQWILNGNNIQGASANTYSYNPTNGDMVSCNLTSGLSCVTVNPTSSNVITMIVNFSCGGSFTINHTFGDVAPINKVVTYGTVMGPVGAADKCWITKNLGASQQGNSVSDSSEASAGWYWQFNKKQGYFHDGTTRLPGSTWNSNSFDNSDWLSINDPCTIELGTGWRIPTRVELNNIDYYGAWTNWNGPWNSVLKLHAAGRLAFNTGELNNRGVVGYYWSSTRYNNYNGWGLDFNSGESFLGYVLMASGFSLRCIRD